MTNRQSTPPEEHICKNCSTEFKGKYCPECGQSVKEFERPFQFLIIDLMGNMFAFDTRFWKTFVSVLFKPGKLALDYVKGHRVKYMPPFRFYVFVSFMFFLLLRIYSSQNVEYAGLNIKLNELADSISIADSSNITPTEQLVTKEVNDKKDNLTLFNEHPDLFYEKLANSFSWAMFLLMPFYAFLLWLFYRKVQPYYITHFILAINQHAFIFVILIIMLLFKLLLPDSIALYSDFLLLIIPFYLVVGHKLLYQQKKRYIILKLGAIFLAYSTVLFVTTIALIILVLLLNGMDINSSYSINVF